MQCFRRSKNFNCKPCYFDIRSNAVNYRISHLCGIKGQRYTYAQEFTYLFTSYKMSSFASALLDELMGRNRNADPKNKGKDLEWSDSEVRLVKQSFGNAFK